VQRMPDLHRKLYQRQIEATDQEIDALVCELYELTEEEIAIVTEVSRKSPASPRVVRRSRGASLPRPTRQPLSTDDASGDSAG